MDPEQCFTQAQTGLFDLYNLARRAQQLAQEMVVANDLCKDLSSNQDWNSRQLAELEQAVLDFISEHKERLVLYGSRAINIFLPDHLKVETSDWDFFLRFKSIDDLHKVCGLAVDFLQARFPARRVWRRNSFHNPNGSFAILVSQRHVLDFSLPPDSLPEPELLGGYFTCPLGWLVNNIQALLVNANAAYRAKKDRNKLLRLLWAASDHQLEQGSLQRSYCIQVLLSLGEVGRPLLDKLTEAKEQKQERLGLEKSLQEKEQLIAKQAKELSKAQQRISQDRTEKLEAELKQLKQSSAAKIAELQKANSRLQSRLEVDSKSREKLVLEQKLEQAKHQIALEEKEKLIEQLSERIAELSLKVEDSVKLRILEDKLQEVIQENHRIKVDYNVKAENVEVLRNSIEGESDRQRTRITQLEKNLASSNKRATESIRSILEQKKQLEALSTRLEKVERELSESERNKTLLLERYYVLRNQVEIKFSENGIPQAFGFVNWSQEAKQAGFGVVIDGAQTTVWLCETCQDGSSRLPERADPCAVLKLQLGKSDITMPVKHNGTLYSICNSCFYENLLANKITLQ